jgi:hypothetical protein
VLEVRLGTRPHWAPTQTAPDLEAQAFGAVPSLTARGILLKQLGAAEYAERMKAWGANQSTLKPGTPPAGEVKDAPRKSKSSNPWSDDPANLDKFGRYNAAAIGRQSALIRAIGLEKSAQIARQYAFIGSTKPGAKQLTPRG